MESPLFLRLFVAGLRLAGAVFLLGMLVAPVRADIIYASNSGAIDTVLSTGMPSTFDTAKLNNPQGLAFSLSGNLYVAKFGDNTIEEFSQTGNDIGTFANTGLSGPTSMAFDSAGNLYATNQGGNTVGKNLPLQLESEAITSIPTTAGLNAPSGLAFDKSGDLYVANASGKLHHEVHLGVEPSSVLVRLPAASAGSRAVLTAMAF